MANWEILTGSNIRLLDTEKTLMSAASPLQDLDSCVTSALNFVRGYIAGGGNTMEDDGVPTECVDDVLTIARYTYLAQDPSATLLTEIRQKEYASAIAHLRDIAKGLATVTQGITATPDITVGDWGSWGKLQMRTETDVAETAPPTKPTPI